MLKVEDTLPDVRIALAPGELVSMRELVEPGPALFFFYLFDWSST
jgi:peroxiredoxin